MFAVSALIVLLALAGLLALIKYSQGKRRRQRKLKVHEPIDLFRTAEAAEEHAADNPSSKSS
jgi:hypothetical protein